MHQNRQDDSTTNKFVAGPYDEAGRVLPEMPTPRPVRLSYRGKSTFIVVFALVVFGVTYTSINEHYHPTGMTLIGGLEFLAFVLIVSGAFLLRWYYAHRRLVSEGEVAIGRVTEMAGSSRLGWYARYEFTPHTGERLSYLTWYTFPFLSVGMALPVFYDRDNPRKRVALSAALYRVELPKDGTQASTARRRD